MLSAAGVIPSFPSELSGYVCWQAAAPFQRGAVALSVVLMGWAALLFVRGAPGLEYLSKLKELIM